MIVPKKLRWVYSIALIGAILLPMTALATFTETVNAGYLYSTPFNTTSSNPGKLPNGALLLLIAAGTGNGQTFTPTPAAGTFVGGGDSILGASSFNTDLGTGGTNGMGGATQSFFNNLPQTTTPNIYIELRWYPTITLTQYLNGIKPTAGTVFGAYNPLATNGYNATTNPGGNTTLNPDGDSTWVQQTASGSYTVDFFTTNYTDAPLHTQPVSQGFANFVVPVPEPSSGILVGAGFVSLVGIIRVLRRPRVV